MSENTASKEPELKLADIAPLCQPESGSVYVVALNSRVREEAKDSYATLVISRSRELGLVPPWGYYPSQYCDDMWKMTERLTGESRMKLAKRGARLSSTLGEAAKLEYRYVMIFGLPGAPRWDIPALRDMKTRTQKWASWVPEYDMKELKGIMSQ